VIRRARAPRSTDVRLTFSLPADSPAGAVSVVGDFNDWTPGAHPLVKRANGHRSASVTLAPGSRVHFRYLGENDHWFDDPDADGFDAHGGVLSV
jgi:1,4-alpha-glucan branching enzyme